jgi:hypothetical protein
MPNVINDNQPRCSFSSQQHMKKHFNITWRHVSCQDEKQVLEYKRKRNISQFWVAIDNERSLSVFGSVI